jgi:hypothetical protein
MSSLILLVVGFVVGVVLVVVGLGLGDVVRALLDRHNQ